MKTSTVAAVFAVMVAGIRPAIADGWADGPEPSREDALFLFGGMVVYSAVGVAAFLRIRRIVDRRAEKKAADGRQRLNQ